MTIAIRNSTSGIRCNCCYHAVSLHIANIIRDPAITFERKEDIISKLLQHFNIRHETELTAVEFIKIINEIPHEQSGKFAQAFLAPTLRTLVHQTNNDLPTPLNITSNGRNNPIAGMETDMAVLLLCNILNIDITAYRPRRLVFPNGEALREANNTDNQYSPFTPETIHNLYTNLTNIESIRPATPPSYILPPVIIFNDRGGTHFEAMGHLQYTSVSQTHPLYQAYGQCSSGTPDPMVLLSRYFIFNRNSQALPAEALLPSVRPAKSESEYQLIAIELNLLNLGFSKSRIDQLKHEVLTKISDLKDQEKKALMLKLIKLEPEYNWENIFLDGLLSITIIGLLIVVPRLIVTTRYFLSPERQARSIILDEIKNSSTTALSY